MKELPPAVKPYKPSHAAVLATQTEVQLQGESKSVSGRFFFCCLFGISLYK